MISNSLRDNFCGEDSITPSSSSYMNLLLAFPGP